MGTTSDKKYPYEIRKFDEKKNNEMKNKYEGDVKLDFIEIGPKKYFLLKKFMPEEIYNLPVKSSDTFIVTFPKSGTTWTQELMWLLGNDLDYEKAKSTSLIERFPFLEMSMFPDLGSILKAISVEEIKNLPEPRFIKSHLPLSLLPPNLLDTTKVIYVARDPRDVAVSFYHHNKLMKMMGENTNLKTFWDYFVSDQVIWGPYFEHVKEAWEKRNHPNLLFLFYEELSKDLSAAIRRVANFLGKEVTDEQVEKLKDHLNIKNFRKNKTVNLEDLQDSGIFTGGPGFVRKGKVGGWRDDFDEEMTATAEKWIADNLRGTDFRFPHF